MSNINSEEQSLLDPTSKATEVKQFENSQTQSGLRLSLFDDPLNYQQNAPQYAQVMPVDQPLGLEATKLQQQQILNQIALEKAAAEQKAKLKEENKEENNSGLLSRAASAPRAAYNKGQAYLGNSPIEELDHNLSPDQERTTQQKIDDLELKAAHKRQLRELRKQQRSDTKDIEQKASEKSKEHGDEAVDNAMDSAKFIVAHFVLMAAASLIGGPFGTMLVAGAWGSLGVGILKGGLAVKSLADKAAAKYEGLDSKKALNADIKEEASLINEKFELEQIKRNDLRREQKRSSYVDDALEQQPNSGNRLAANAQVLVGSQEEELSKIAAQQKSKKDSGVVLGSQ